MPAPSRRLRAEVLIVLGLSLGQSALWAVWWISLRYASATPVGQQSTQLNPSRASQPFFDATAQGMRAVFAVVPVALVLYLLSASGERARERLGLVWGKGASRRRDLAMGVGLAALIGLPGLAWYVLGRALGQTVRIDVSGLPDAWWAILALLMSALAAALLEEVVGVAYLLTRLREMAWSPAAAITASALLRGTYHLYQGWPMAVGNAVMGAVFALYFTRAGRVGPLIAAHATLDLVAFVGPEVVPESWLISLGIASPGSAS